MAKYSGIEALSCGGILDYSDISDIIKFNKKIKVYFDFNWETYKSKIVAEGLDDGYKICIDTPQVPLVGGCFSEYVYVRMVTGQMFVSNMLDMVSFNLDFTANKLLNTYNPGNEKVEIIKIDRCFYAPFLYTWKENGKKEYSHMLEDKYPEALKALKGLNPDENYWEKYHDNH